eukprot:TRINITY_DN11175_c3_g2_i2.p1 TRINITY_DN11175_c3_g2~~TRINITY_DN11175_c3_g2_i2.p1  ORF type:complete len:185 (+),score=17.52 TRINITY_DN11175_c3_g2_i2:80-634(+)
MLLFSWPTLLAFLMAFAGAEELVPNHRFINLLMWNPHWQCFVWNQHNCKGQASAHLTRWLAEKDIDFATVVEMSDSSWRPPTGYEINVSHCGRDISMQIANTKRWRPLPGNVTDCMVYADRPFVARAYEANPATSSAPTDGEERERVIVVSAHFPHPVDMQELQIYDKTSHVKRLRDGIAKALG